MDQPAPGHPPSPGPSPSPGPAPSSGPADDSIGPLGPLGPLGPPGAPSLAVVAERPIHTGRRFDYVEMDVKTPGDGPIIRHQGVRHDGAAVIVPVLDSTEGPRVLLIQNDRPITGERLWELPAGMRDRVDDGAGGTVVEDPARTAAREVVEETGYRAGRVLPLGSFYCTPGITDENMHAFAALDLTHVGQELEHGETITVHPATPAQALAMIDDGRMIDAKSILGLLLAHRRGLLGDA